MSLRPSRRTVLKGAIALSAVPVVGFSAIRRRPGVRSDPFTLGIASGEPSADGMVLWTRLAPDPLADDGLGGMTPGSVDVEWEVAADERFTRIEQRGIATATADVAHSVHVETTGLRPGADYFYRFRVGGHLSPAGRTRTAPDPRSAAATLSMCVASCANYQQGWFTAYRRIAEQHPDLVVHLGDYLYEYAAGTGNVRDHVGPQARTLANYRQRHAQYKTDADLQAAHAAAPWLAVFDDHELADNWADETPEIPQPGFRQRRAAALQAYYEHMPLRSTAVPRGADMRLYRRVRWGGLATFHLLDTRQYRDDQACGDRFGSDCAERADPTRTLTGGDQEHWLLNGFRQSRARWDILAQQVFFAQVDLTPGPLRGFNPDAWDGYAANRDRIITGLVDSPVRNAVILTGDIHSHWAAEVHERSDDQSSPVVATEFVTTSISSGGDGSESRADIAGVLADNPHIRYFNGRRGYIHARVTPDELRADFRVVPFVSRPDAAVRTAASFVVPDRAPALYML